MSSILNSANQEERQMNGSVGVFNYQNFQQNQNNWKTVQRFSILSQFHQQQLLRYAQTSIWRPEIQGGNNNLFGRNLTYIVTDDGQNDVEDSSGVHNGLSQEGPSDEGLSDNTLRDNTLSNNTLSNNTLSNNTLSDNTLNDEAKNNEKVEPEDFKENHEVKLENDSVEQSNPPFLDNVNPLEFDWRQFYQENSGLDPIEFLFDKTTCDFYYYLFVRYAPLDLVKSIWGEIKGDVLIKDNEFPSRLMAQAYLSGDQEKIEWVYRLLTDIRVGPSIDDVIDELTQGICNVKESLQSNSKLELFLQDCFFNHKFSPSISEVDKNNFRKDLSSLSNTLIIERKIFNLILKMMLIHHDTFSEGIKFLARAKEFVLKLHEKHLEKFVTLLENIDSKFFKEATVFDKLLAYIILSANSINTLLANRPSDDAFNLKESFKHVRSLQDSDLKVKTKLKNDGYEILKQILKLTPDLKYVYGAIKGEARSGVSENNLIDNQSQLPSESQFPSQFQFLEHLEMWLDHAIVYKRLPGIIYASEVIYHAEDYPNLIEKALFALESLAVNVRDRDLIEAVERIVMISSLDSLKAQAIKTRCLIDRLESNQELLKFLSKILKQVESHPDFIKTRETVIQMFRLYDFESEEESSSVVDLLIPLLETSEEALKALIAIPNQEGLFAAHKVLEQAIQNDVLYSTFDPLKVRSQFWLSILRPEWLQNKSQNLMRRFENQQVKISLSDNEFCQLIDEKLQNFIVNPKSIPELHLIDRSLNLISKIRAKCISLPIFFPENSYLIGEQSFGFEEVKNLILGKCGVSRFTHELEQVRGNSNHLAGEVFSGELKTEINPDIIRVVISQKFFQREYVKGEVRVNKDKVLNVEFFRPIPNHWIECIYMPQRLENDMRLIAGQQAISSIRSELSDLFKWCGEMELEELRSRLLIKEVVGFAGELIPNSSQNELTLFERIKFGEIEDLKSKFCTIEEVKQRSLWWAIARYEL